MSGASAESPLGITLCRISNGLRCVAELSLRKRLPGGSDTIQMGVGEPIIEDVPGINYRKNRVKRSLPINSLAEG